MSLDVERLQASTRSIKFIYSYSTNNMVYSNAKIMELIEMQSWLFHKKYVASLNPIYMYEETFIKAKKLPDKIQI